MTIQDKGKRRVRLRPGDKICLMKRAGTVFCARNGVRLLTNDNRDDKHLLKPRSLGQFTLVAYLAANASGFVDVLTAHDDESRMLIEIVGSGRGRSKTRQGDEIIWNKLNGDVLLCREERVLRSYQMMPVNYIQFAAIAQLIADTAGFDAELVEDANEKTTFEIV